ncbi:hypothetical protein HYQ46_012890 [Verticillium longisporum]|nr:hypothetical protein HYQ46_012890 [Verticillium longisporum]
MLDNASSPDLDSSLQLSDPSDAMIVSAPTFLETVYADFAGPSRAGSRAPTPMLGEYPAQQTPRRHLQRPSAVPQVPDVSSVNVSSDPNAEFTTS